jgi:biopolymer transport protein ExbB
MPIDLAARLTTLTQFGAAWIFWLLLALSVIALAITFERAWALLLGRGDASACRHELTALLRKGDLAAARARARRSTSLEARVAASGLDEPLSTAEAAGRRMEGEMQVVRLEMERRLAFLGTLGNNAPFIGLLGTVLGIVRAFRALDGAAGKVTAGLMSDVGEALIATAVGLVVALPAIAAFNVFQRLVKVRMALIDALRLVLLAALTNRTAGVASEEG